MAVDIFRIPHASTVYVDRSRGQGALCVVTALLETGETPAEEQEKQELMQAIRHSVPRLGLDGYRVTWASAEDTLLEAPFTEWPRS